MENIIGYELEKQRVEGLADILKNHNKYKEKGVYIPKGLLLTGPAGVGKTMFAKYLAELSGAKLFIFTPSAEDDTELKNSQKIKKLFEKAKNNTPAIIFVDEFDNYMPDDYFDSDERSDFLAATLKALDGEGYEGIMFVAACIDRDDIPDEVLRSGRIDEHIRLSKPDVCIRKEIIDYYESKVGLTFDVNSSVIAYKTPGFVGADLKNLINMVSRVAISLNKDAVFLSDFLEAIYSIENKDIRRPKDDENEKLLCAVHEVGHLLLGKIKLHCSSDVTVDSYDYVKGMTSPIEKYDNENRKRYSLNTQNKQYYLNHIMVILAGMAAEKMVFKTVTGSQFDINRSVKLIKETFKDGHFGFKYLCITSFDERYDWSEKHKNLFDRKTLKVIKYCYNKSLYTIKRNRKLFSELVNVLMEKTVLISEESDVIFAKYGL